MAGEQTVTISSATNTTVKVVVNAIGSSGSHVALVVDTTTTRLDGRSTVPTVYYPTGSTGIAEISFSVASSSLNEFTTLICRVNGTADSVAFSEYAIPVKVLQSEANSNTEVAASVWGETASNYNPSNFPLYTNSFGARLLESAETYLSNIGLDHLVANAVTGSDVADNSIAARLVSKSATADWDSYNNTTDSLEAISDSAFDPSADTVANVTTVGSVTGSVGSVTAAVTTDAASRTASQATGFSTHSASDVVTAMQAVAGDFKATGFSTHSAADVADAVWDESRTGHTTSGTFGFYLDAAISSISGGGGTSITAQDIADIADAVWDETITSVSHNSTNSAGNYLYNMLLDTGTTIPNQISALNDFDPANDTVANVTTVGSVTNAVTTDAASRTASQADVSGLATSASISALNDLSAAEIRSALGMATANLDTQLNSISTGIPSEAEIYSYFTASDGVGGQREDVFKADVSGIGDLSNVATDVAAIKAKTDVLTFTGSNLHTHVQDVLASAATTIATSAYTYFTYVDAPTSTDRPAAFKAASSDIYDYFTDLTREDAFKADVTSLSSISTNVDAIKVQTDKIDFTTVGQVDYVRATVDTLPQAVLDAIYNKFTDQSNEDVFKADISALETNVAAILADTSQLSFTNGLVDANASVAITQTDAATIYDYFVDGTREDVFKADVASLATQASVDTVDGIVDAIKLQTDKLTFNASNEVASEVKSGSTPADIYNHFISGAREDAFKNSDVEIRQAIGMSAADLDVQLDAIVEDTGTTIPNTLSGIVTDIGNVPTVAEFEARTILSADYYDPTVDPVIVGTNNDKTGYSISGTKTTLDDLADFDPATDAVDIGKVFGDAGSAESLKDSAKQMTRCTVTNQSTPATAGGRSSFSSASVTTAAADHFVGRLILFTSGTLEGQASDIVDYELSNGVGLFSVTELTSDPSVNDTFIIV